MLNRCRKGGEAERGNCQPDFYQAIKSAMSSECCCCRLSQKSKERPSVTDTDESENQPNPPPPPKTGQVFHPPCPVPAPLLWELTRSLCIIDGNFKTCLKNFTHLQDLQFVCFVLLCVRLTLILMDQTYGNASERESWTHPLQTPCSLCHGSKRVDNLNKLLWALMSDIAHTQRALRLSSLR